MGASTLPGAVATSGDGTGQSPSARPSPRARPRHFVWFTPALGLLLGGYLFFSKPFAYIHIPGTPLFVGEVVLGIGIVEVLQVRSPWRHLLATAPVLKVLAVFMGVCSIRLARDLPVYQLDAIRDSSIWYYGIFAFLAAAAAVREPTFVPRLLRWYRLVLPWYFLWAPIAVVLAEVDALAAISLPGTNTPINAFRINDIAVHLGLGLAFLWLGVDRLVEGYRPRVRDAWLSILGVLGLLIAASQSRGGFLAALGTAAVAFAYLPAGRRRRLVFSVTAGLLVVLTVVWTLDLRLQGERRDVSLQQLTANVASIAGSTDNEELSGTVQWREGFWEQVLNDLLSSQAWLNGIGFGPILPERYEVDVGNTNNNPDAQPLRSVHNSHLTILARVGFPGFGLWVLLWLTFAVQLIRWVRRRPGGVRDPEAALGVWYLASVVGFLSGAYFDPSLEGPHAGIWLFTLVGLAAAQSRVGRRPSISPRGMPRPPMALLGHLSSLSPSALLVHARNVVRQLGWGVADQAMSSLTNFGIGIYVARSLGIQEFGAFSLAFATYLIVLFGLPRAGHRCPGRAVQRRGGRHLAPGGGQCHRDGDRGRACRRDRLRHRRPGRSTTPPARPARARADPARSAAPGQLALRVLLGREGREGLCQRPGVGAGVGAGDGGDGGDRALHGRLDHARLGRVGRVRGGRRGAPGTAGPATRPRRSTGSASIGIWPLGTWLRA